jgi:hypothetical protein
MNAMQLTAARQNDFIPNFTGDTPVEQKKESLWPPTLGHETVVNITLHSSKRFHAAEPTPSKIFPAAILQETAPADCGQRKISRQFRSQTQSPHRFAKRTLVSWTTRFWRAP